MTGLYWTLAAHEGRLCVPYHCFSDEMHGLLEDNHEMHATYLAAAERWHPVWWIGG